MQVKETQLQPLNEQRVENVVENVEAERLGEIARLEKENKFAARTRINLAELPELHAIFTKDQMLLKQYYELRRDIFVNEVGWSHYDSLEDDYDRRGEIIVALDGDKVVGGMRLLFSDKCKALTGDIPGTKYEYRKLISKYDERKDIVLCELSAFAVKDGYRNESVTITIFNLMLDRCRGRCDYIVFIAPLPLCRKHRIALKKAGANFKIVTDFPWKEREAYGSVKPFPMYTKFDSDKSISN